MTLKESESFLEHKARKRKGSQGKATESEVQKVLVQLKTRYQDFDFDRQYDTRSAGTLMPACVSDYTVFFRSRTYALEVKEISKGMRLPKFVQLPRMLRRQKAGVIGVVLVHFLEEDVWFWKDIGWFAPGAASYDFSAEQDSCRGADEALRRAFSI